MKDSLKFKNIWDPSVTDQHRISLLDWRNRDDIRKNMIGDSKISQFDHSSWLDSLKNENPTSQVRLVFFKDSPIGVIYLGDIDDKNGCSSWGFYIGDDSFRGMGLGRYMLMEILRWGFSDLGLRRLYTSVLSTNERALAMYIRHGFRVEGCWREHLLRDGKAVDLYWMGMLRSEWAPSRS